MTCGSTCQREFRKDAFLLRAEAPKYIAQSQYGLHVTYVLYRAVCGMYFLGMQLYDWVWWKDPEYYIYLTNWSISVLTLSAVYRTVVAAIHFARSRKVAGLGLYDKTPIHFQVSWVLYNVSSVAGLLVTVLYWVVLYTGDPIPVTGISAHAVNSIYIICDVMITGMPVRVVHAYHTMVYGALYAIFTVVYWAAGNPDPIYSIMDWGNNPALAAGLVLGMIIVGIPIIQAVLFGISLLRKSLACHCATHCGSRKTYPVEEAGRQTEMTRAPCGKDNPAFQTEDITPY